MMPRKVPPDVIEAAPSVLIYYGKDYDAEVRRRAPHVR